MHEAALALDLVEMVTARAAGARVSRIVLEVGTLAAVLPDALSFAFDCAIEGTPMAGAKLEVVKVPGQARCRACGATLTLERPFGRCACGGSELEWLSGEELKVREIEVES